MPESKIRRKYRALTVSLSTATSAATTLRWDDAAGGAIRLGTHSTSMTSIQVWASESFGGTFGRLYNSDGSAADITLAASTTDARVYSLPDATYGCGAIKLVAGSTHGTAASAVVLVKT